MACLIIYTLESDALNVYIAYLGVLIGLKAQQETRTRCTRCTNAHYVQYVHILHRQRNRVQQSIHVALHFSKVQKRTDRKCSLDTKQEIMKCFKT